MSLFILHQRDDPFFIGNSELKLKIKEYSAIYIDGNAELESYAIDGTGGELDPYIIENLVINASGLGNGIYIQNTNAYFILRNCVITNADLYCAGISLSNVTNAKITNNTVYNSYDGILLCRSSNNMLKNNTLNINLEIDRLN
jgi:parallel beta-helix repeat protein